MHNRICNAMLCSLALISAAAAGPQRDHEVVPEDYFGLGVITSVVMSPDGRFVAYTESRWEPPKDGRNTDLWTVETTSRTTQRLTFDAATVGSVQWSPDGQFIYYTSNRKRAGEEDPPWDGKKQVWRISPTGGEPLAVTRVKDGVSDFNLSSDGRFIYFSREEEVVDEEWEDLRKKYDELEYGHGVTKFTQIWKLDLQNWRSEKIVDDHRVVVDFEVSPDRSKVAMITRPDETLLSNEGWSRVDVYDAGSEKITNVTPDGWRDAHHSPFGWLDSVSWSDDSAALAFTVSFDGYPPLIYVVEWSGKESALREVGRPKDISVTGGTIDWRGGGRDLCVIGQDRARSRLYLIEGVRSGAQGKTECVTEGDVAVSHFSYTPSGRALAVVMGTPTTTPDIYLVSATKGFEQLTKINPQVDRWKLPQMSIVQWKGADGVPVEGILELPPDHKPGKRLPMIVEIHGGPTSATLYSLRMWIYGRTLMASKGFALLSPNYRGSTGFGDQFMIDLIGRENDVEVIDIMTGVEAMIERGIADPDRIGVMGWSNGGYLTNCLITRSDRFKAASSGAGVLDQVIQWGIEDTPGHVINYMSGKQPWDHPDEYRSASPLYHLNKVKTPTLIHVGGNDPRVPPAHSRTLYRALRHYLKVPVELIVYPNQGHGLTTYKNRKAKMEWDLAWFDRYLLEKTDEGEKDDSSS